MVDYDLATANQMLKTGRYVYVIFMCHLAIEKLLKAGVYHVSKQIPPKTHDLIFLIGLLKINLPKDLLDFVGVINNAAIVTRYPDDLSRLVASYPKVIAKEYLTNAKRVILWTKKELGLKK